MGAAVPLPEEGFLHRRTLELTLHVSLSVVDEAGDGRQGAPGLRHAAVAVVNSWENMDALKTPLKAACFPRLCHRPHLICTWSRGKTSETRWQSKISGNPDGTG